MADDDHDGDIATSIADLEADDPTLLVIKIEQRLRPTKIQSPRSERLKLYHQALSAATR
jgi:hypothetical protein